MTGGQLNSMRHPQLETMEEAATWCVPEVGHRSAPAGTYAYHAYTSKVAVVQTPMPDHHW